MSSREQLHSILARSGNVFPGLQAAQRFLVRLHRLMRVLLSTHSGWEGVALQWPCLLRAQGAAFGITIP
jgi:hypothetical protein